MAGEQGGPRQGRPGVQYPQRSDMQSGDRAYGDGVNKAAVRRATPQAPAPRQPASVTPGSFGPLVAPTERPDEPVTAGLRLGAGPGPEALGGLTNIAPVNQELADVRELFRQYPYEGFRRFLERVESEA